MSASGPVAEAAAEYLAARDSQPLSCQAGYEGWLNRMDEVDRRLRAALAGEPVAGGKS